MTPSASKKLPPVKYRQVVDELANRISNPIQKLKFLKFFVGNYNKFTTHDELKAVLDSIIEKRTNPQEIEYFVSLRQKLAQSVHPFSHPYIQGIYKNRFIIMPAAFLFFIFSVGMIVLITGHMRHVSDHNGEQSVVASRSSSPVMPVPRPPAVAPKKEEPEIRQAEISVQMVPSPPELVVEQEYPKYLDKVIWLVEKTRDSEVYSNRLKIITSYTTDNVPRRYYAFSKNTPVCPEPDEVKSAVAGILYHASESDIFEFKPEMSDSIKKYSRALIKYLRKRKAYHYLIDRFGRVYRIVREDHAAFHGGNAVWSDDESIYLNLNHAFIGICFEGRDFEMENTEDGESNVQKIVPMEQMSINEAQIVSGKELTDWLRVKYNIPQGSCVPHCLVSLNPRSLLIGHHLDLSRGFPFNEYGLSNKYKEAIPAITEFGFSYDQYFLNIFDGDIWPGISLSENYLDAKAKEHGMSSDGYRKLLNNRFTHFFDWRIQQEELYTKQDSQEKGTKSKEAEFKVEKTDKI